MSTLGTRIKVMRMSRGLSQIDLAKMVGASRSAVTMWENDARRPSLDMFDALADAFNVPISAILNDEKQQEEDDEICLLREELRRNPEIRMLFSASRGAKKEHIKAAAAMLNALKGNDDSLE